ncbi:MAG: hypothetical protein AAFQ12_12035, partial [Pseudomonadota bacterium]
MSKIMDARPGAPLGDCGARYTFAQVSRRVGLRKSTGFKRHGTGPRIHDLRHTFAVRTISFVPGDDC